MLNTLQRTAAFTNANMAGAALVDAQAKAMQAAASNPGGAAIGFMNMGMAQQAGGMNAAQLFQMGAQQQAMQQQSMQQSMGQGMTQQSMQSAPAAGAWKCECGTDNTGKFCQGCGKPKPAVAEGWSCSCGAVNQGKFCQNCGKPKPAGAPIYRCDKCGWNPPDPANPPKFCPECGDPFDDGDIQ